MLRYLLTFFCFGIVLIIQLAFRTGGFSFLTESAAVIALLSSPFFLFGLISAGMEKVLNGNNREKVIMIPKRFWKLQFLLSCGYLVLLIFLLKLPPFYRSGHSQAKDCSEENIKILSGVSYFADSVQRVNYRAYRSLISTLESIGKGPSDTQICITGLEFVPIDTVVNAQRMKACVTLSFTVRERKGESFQFMYCCNDTDGCVINKYPLAILD